jgi:hypothetical protein
MRRREVNQMDEPRESPIIDAQKGAMDFALCVEALLLGKKMRRLEWKAKDYIVINDEKLMIFKPDDKRLHPLTVSTGDMMARDWVVVEKEVNLA